MSGLFNLRVKGLNDLRKQRTINCFCYFLPRFLCFFGLFGIKTRLRTLNVSLSRLNTIFYPRNLFRSRLSAHTLEYRLQPRHLKLGVLRLSLNPF